MWTLPTWIIFILLILLSFSRKEAFKVELKTDFGSFDGLNAVATAATVHVKHLQNSLWDVAPFRAPMRALHRRFRKMYR